METFSALLALCAGNSPVTGAFPTKSPVTRSFVLFFFKSAPEQLSKQSRRRRFETPSCSFWSRCNNEARLGIHEKFKISCWPKQQGTNIIVYSIYTGDFASLLCLIWWSWTINKMGDILQDIFKCIFLNENVWFTLVCSQVKACPN